MNNHNRYIKNNDADNRRKGKDRRSFDREKDFPLKTRNGAVVTKDRRTSPERRLSNISVEITDLDEQEFAEFFDHDQS